MFFFGSQQTLDYIGLLKTPFFRLQGGRSWIDGEVTHFIFLTASGVNRLKSAATKISQPRKIFIFVAAAAKNSTERDQRRNSNLSDKRLLQFPSKIRLGRFFQTVFSFVSWFVYLMSSINRFVSADPNVCMRP